jgi:HEAT repeat protein
MKRLRHARSIPFLWCCLLAADPPAAGAYITAPVQTLGQLCAWSTYITVVRVEKLSQEKGVILYRKVRDLKGTYPLEVIRHAFDLKNTPPHKGPGDVPIRPDEVDWKYALKWAEVGKTAVVCSFKYDPYGDFGHTYIDRCWYATMCPKRDWDWWYSIYSDPALLSRWHCGTPAQLASALEPVLAGKTAVVPTLVEGSTREELRQGRGRIQGLRVSLKIEDFNPARDRVAGWLSKELPELVRDLGEPDRQVRLQALRDLAVAGPEGKAAASKVVPFLQDADEEICVAALQALGQIGPEPTLALPALITALGARSLPIRRAAAEAVGQMGAAGRESAPVLAKLLPAAGLERLEIARALGRVDPENPDIVPAVLPLLGHADPERRLQAAEVLTESAARAQAAGPALMGLLKEPDSRHRLRAIELLARSGVAPAEVAAAVSSLFDDPERDVRLGAGAVLAERGALAKWAVPALIKAMKDSVREVRIQAAEILGSIGPDAKSAVSALAEAVRTDTSGTVRMRSADALGRLGPEAKAARPALEAALKDPAMAGRPEVLARIRELQGRLK